MSRVLGDDPFAERPPEQPEASQSDKPSRKARAVKRPAVRSKSSRTRQEAAEPKGTSEPQATKPARKPSAGRARAARTVRTQPSQPAPAPVEPQPAPAPVESQPAPAPVEPQPVPMGQAEAPSPAAAGALVPMSHLPAAVPLPRRARVLSPLARRYRDLALRLHCSEVDDFGLDPAVLRRAEVVLDLLYERYFRLEATGIGHVPDHGRVLLVANRAGTLPYDSLMLAHALRREHPVGRLVRPLLDDMLIHAPFLGVLLQRLGAVRACQDNAERLLRGEHVVAVFPEGQKGSSKTYRERYQLQRFGRGGFIKLALRTRTPILPVAIVGSEEAQPLLGKIGWLGKPLGLPHLPITPTFPWLGLVGLLPLPSKWRIAIGEPLHFYTEHDPHAAEDQGLVGRLADRVRGRIQEMLDGLLRQRRSVLWG
ncbi:MAG: 1-acyl-sn-glycerol-3-phosphate acyltransferase [Myxococcales bacterium]|nr:1-acyl-sn-glycerol-3-phosphate acyltransferase [Myxococcota bacterium]MDW8281948.1 1-acyl-sn-glycerol-3-phosphate acyltransferase [Myxococcales bacterium]